MYEYRISTSSAVFTFFRRAKVGFRGRITPPTHTLFFALYFEPVCLAYLVCVWTHFRDIVKTIFHKNTTLQVEMLILRLGRVWGGCFGTMV